MTWLWLPWVHRRRRAAAARRAQDQQAAEQEAARQRLLAQARAGHHWNGPTVPVPVDRPLMTPLARLRTNRGERP